MSDEALLELVSAASDGELDRRRQAAVERGLRNSAEARRFLTDLERLDILMSSLPEPRVPDALHARIMAAAGSALRKPGPRRAIRLPAFVLGYGLAAAAGVVLTLGYYEWHLGVPDATDYAALGGTMVPGDKRVPARILGRETTRLPEVAGRVELQQHDGELLLDIRVEAAEKIDLTLDFTTAGVRPVGVIQRRNQFEFVEITDRLLRTRGAGSHEVSVSLRRVEDAAVGDEAAIRLEYSSNGRVLKQGSLSSAID